MRVIAVKHLRAFWRRHPDAENALRAWHAEAAGATWRTPRDIKKLYASASFLPGNRVVFNIRGNEYRLVVAVAWRFKAIYVKFIGTHAQYDRIDASTIDMN